MALVDIFAPSISKVSSGIEGKSILIYGGNKCGKTNVAASMPKPFVFAFELGLEALPNIPYIYPERWSIFESALDQFCRNPAKAREHYQTLIIDQLEAMYACCEKFVCDNAGVNSISQKPILPNGKENGWWNGYVEIDKIISDVIKKIRFLLDSGFTFMFIAHEGVRKNEDDTEKIYPRGSKRIIDPMVDLVGYIGYVKSNGVDENGKVVKSSLYLNDSPSRLGGSRYGTIIPMLSTYTADGLVEAIKNANEAEVKEAGAATVSNQELVESRTKASTMTYDEVKEKCVSLCKAVAKEDSNCSASLRTIIEKHLGVGRSITADTTPNQVDLMIVIYEEICAYVQSTPSLSAIEID